jgi:superfamily II DNA or RNA helicase
VHQAHWRLLEEGIESGRIVASSSTAPTADVQCGTCQTLLNATRRPEDVGLVVLDEAHHYAQTDWAAVHEAYPEAELVGLTATPQRSDGGGLGDTFSLLVVAATYAELLEGGHLCPCPRENVLAPPPDACDYDLACHPLEAWKRYGHGRPTLAYCSSVAQGAKFRDAFRDAGIQAGLLTAATKPAERNAVLSRFQAGELPVLWSVGILTEGVDLPRTGCIELARPCEHQSTYLQITGRGLRPHESKRDLVLIDLVGATLRHGYPTEERVYSLHESEPIKRTSATPLRQCLRCGHTIAAFFRACPDCGYVHGPKGRHAPRIHSLELSAVYEAENTPKDAKARELLRLVGEAKRRGYALGWVGVQYKTLFGDVPDLSGFASEFADSDKSPQARFAQLRAEGEKKGYKPGWAAFRFKSIYGYWPRGRSATA